MSDRFEEAIEIAKAWNEAWLARDLETMKRLAAEEYIQWHSHIRKEFTKAEEFALLKVALKVMHISFHDAKLFPVEGGAVQQCLGDIKLSNGVEVKDVPFAMVYQIRDGQIYRCDEYVDGRALPKMDFIPQR